MTQTGKLKAWHIFIRERFPPFTYLPFLTLYFVAHYVLISEKHTMPVWHLLLIWLVTILFFFKLRLYDEIKDYESDRIGHPDRPLVRGVLSRAEVSKAIVLGIIAEVGIFSLSGITGVLAMAVPVVYSLLMFKEFFLRRWLRAHLTLYAVTHTFVSGLFSLALLSVLQSTALWELHTDAFLFALISWCLFTIFEFGRKTFLSGEEKKTIDSYSKIYGRGGAAMLVLVLTLCSVILIALLPNTKLALPLLAFYILLLALSARLFITKNSPPWGILYRKITFFFIAFVYLSFIISTLIK